MNRACIVRLRRRLAALAALALLSCAGGCRILSDEFAWLDRAGPVTEDPRVSGEHDRP